MTSLGAAGGAASSAAILRTTGSKKGLLRRDGTLLYSDHEQREVQQPRLETGASRLLSVDASGGQQKRLHAI